MTLKNSLRRASPMSIGAWSTGENRYFKLKPRGIIRWTPEYPSDNEAAGSLTRIFQCAVKSHGSPVGETKQTHPGTNSLRPEPPGGVMEVTKSLKHFRKRPRRGSGSAQAIT